MPFGKGLAVTLSAFAFIASLTVTETAAAEATQISLATSAPRNSPWGKVMRTWAVVVKKKSNEELKLKIYWNNSQGGEEATIGKMRAGQLDGAAVTAVGLGKIYKPILTLQIPGLFKNWGELDKVREKLTPDFKNGAEKEGFYLAGFGDVGLYYLMSKDRPIKTPNDIKGLKPYRLVGDEIIPVVAQELGVTAVPVTIPTILPALTSGRINVCLSPALAAEQLQWAPQLNYFTDKVMAMGIGALVFSKKSLDRLPAKHKDLLLKTGAKAAKMLTTRIRKLDDEAYNRIKGRMKVVSLSGGESKQWDKVFERVQKKLGQGTFDAKLIKKIKKLVGK